MPETRRIWLIAFICLAFLGAVGISVQHFLTRSTPRPMKTWSGTISSGVPAQAAESESQQLIAVSEPSHADLLEDLNRYWLARVNALRAEKGLRTLRSDVRLITTAGEWAGEMAMRREVTHARIDGKTMHQWIDTKQLEFTERGVDPGWRTSYFVENIARAYAKPTAEGMKRALDSVLDAFLSEGPGGDHYESIFHPDWNGVGLGYAFDPVEKTSRTYFAFHYGSLK